MDTKRGGFQAGARLFHFPCRCFRIFSIVFDEQPIQVAAGNSEDKLTPWPITNWHFPPLLRAQAFSSFCKVWFD